MNRFVLAALICVSGCGFDSTAARDALRSDSAGVEIVANPGEDRPLDWRFERVWQVGGIGDERFLLSRLSRHQVAADTAGRIYVLDASAQRVLVLSAGGALVDTLGRPGGGPGELRSPIALSVARDGTIGVYDMGRGGLARWAADGRPLELLRLEPMYWSPKLDIVKGGVLYTTRRRRGGEPEDRLILWAPGSARMLARLERLPSRIADFPSCGAGRITVAPLFAPELLWDAGRGRVAINAGGQYVIDIYERGRLVRSIRRDVVPRRVDEHMALREADGWMLNDCVPPPAEVVRGTGYAEVLPSVRALELSLGGELWVLRGRVADERARIDIFASDGRYVGTLPSGSPFPAAFLPDGRMVAVEKDSLDVPRIALYRIFRP